MTKICRAGRRKPRTASRRGFTLVELMIAILVMAVGFLGLAGLSVVAGSQWRGSEKQQRAALVIQGRFDSLTSVPCANLAAYGAQTGTSTLHGIVEHWRVTDGNDVKVITDSVTIPGRKRVLIYTSVIPCRD